MTPGAAGAERRRRRAALWWLVAGASLWLRSGFAVHAIGPASLDDALFVGMAKSLGAGRWLGPFNDLTLAKGAFYPMFLLAAFLCGIPLKLAEQAVYLAASALVARLAGRGARWDWAGLALFAALAFDPVLWTVGLARVVREALYVGLSLGLFGATVAIAFSTARSTVGLLWRGVGLGLLGGAFWLTREEGVWLLPALVIVLACAWLGGAWPGWRGAAVLAVSTACGCGVLVGGTVAMNLRVYGVAQTVDVRSASFQHAYGAISRISPAQWRRYVVFPADARAQAYRISPAARALEPFFEGTGGETWRRIGCREMPSEECSETLSPWFQWALRDAVAQAGHYRSAPEAMRFYDQLAREIDAACDAGSLACLPPRATLAPPFRPDYLPDATRSAARLLVLLGSLGGNEVAISPSVGTAVELAGFADLVGPIARAPATVTVVRGRATTPGGPAAVFVRPGDGITAWQSAVSDGDTSDFTLSTDCPPDRCTLVAAADGRDLATAPLAAPPPRIERPDVTFETREVSSVPLGTNEWHRQQAILAVTRLVGRVYAWTGPVLIVAGALGTGLMLLLRPRAAGTVTFALAAGSAVALLGRVALLAYVDVTAIPSVNLQYLSPAVPFAIVLAGAGLMLVVPRRRDGGL